MENGYKFKILSLDGGGIKGLYTAAVLAQLEEEYQCHMADYFDMICGTSTGGLIALALSLRIPARELVDFYHQKGPAIFGRNNFIENTIRSLQQALFEGKYGNKVLKQAIIDVLGADKKMSDANTLLCIPSFNLMKGIPRVFKYPHAEGNVPKAKYGTMVDVALATSAAPTYFPIATIDDCYYVDGGVWANNPTLCGMLEALQYFVGPGKTLRGINEGKSFNRYAILSIGSIAEYSAWTTQGRLGFKKRRSRSFMGWGDKLFQTSLDAQSQFADNFASKMISNTIVPGEYHRISGPNLSPDHYKIIGLDNASRASLVQLRTFGNNVGDDYRTSKRHLVEDYFKEKKQYLTH